MRRTALILSAALWIALPISNSAQELAIENKGELLLISDYRTIVEIEHDSRHLYHLQTKALVAHLGGWARPANEDGSEIDSFTGVSEQVIPINLNRIKARIRRGDVDEEIASELSEIISVFEKAIETSLELASKLELGDLPNASEIYRARSIPEYERLWRRTYTLRRDIERKL